MLDDLRRTLPSARPLFGVVVDASNAGPMKPDLRDLLVHAIKFLASRGMVRMAVCVPTHLVASQFKHLSAESETLPGLRCLDSTLEGWNAAAQSWAISGREPPAEFVIS